MMWISRKKLLTLTLITENLSGFTSNFAIFSTTASSKTLNLSLYPNNVNCRKERMRGGTNEAKIDSIIFRSNFKNYSNATANARSLTDNEAALSVHFKKTG